MSLEAPLCLALLTQTSTLFFFINNIKHFPVFFLMWRLPFVIPAIISLCFIIFSFIFFFPPTVFCICNLPSLRRLALFVSVGDKGEDMGNTNTHGDGGSYYHINEETHYQIYEGWSHQAPSFCCYETSSERKPCGRRLREAEEG